MFTWIIVVLYRLSVPFSLGRPSDSVSLVQLPQKQHDPRSAAIEYKDVKKVCCRGYLFQGHLGKFSVSCSGALLSH